MSDIDGRAGDPVESAGSDRGEEPTAPSNLWRGAFRSARVNPAATVGSTVVIAVLLEAASAAGGLVPAGGTAWWGGAARAAADGAATLLSSVVLIGVLAPVVDRGVRGRTMTFGRAWAAAGSRWVPLAGLAAVFGAVLALTDAATALVPASSIAGLVAALILLVGLLYLGTVICFAAAAITLDGDPLPGAASRAVALVRGNPWFAPGTVLVAWLAASLAMAAIAAPFDLLGRGPAGLLPPRHPSVLSTLGAVVGDVVVLPIVAGIVVLCYTDCRDRRRRAGRSASPE